MNYYIWFSFNCNASVSNLDTHKVYLKLMCWCLFLVVCVVLVCALTFRVMISTMISSYKRCSVRLYPLLVCRRGSCLNYVIFILLVHSCVQHLLWFLFGLFSSSMLPVSLEFPFLIAHSVCSNVIYIHLNPNVAQCL
jgi:hypothetical protein